MFVLSRISLLCNVLLGWELGWPNQLQSTLLSQLASQLKFDMIPCSKFLLPRQMERSIYLHTINCKVAIVTDHKHHLMPLEWDIKPQITTRKMCCCSDAFLDSSCLFRSPYVDLKAHCASCNFSFSPLSATEKLTHTMLVGVQLLSDSLAAFPFFVCVFCFGWSWWWQDSCFAKESKRSQVDPHQLWRENTYLDICSITL